MKNLKKYICEEIQCSVLEIGAMSFLYNHISQKIYATVISLL